MRQFAKESSADRLPLIDSVEQLYNAIMLESPDRVSEMNYQQGDWILRREKTKLARVTNATVERAPFLYTYCRTMHISDTKLAAYRARRRRAKR